MQPFVLVIHVFIAVALIVLILLQHGKGAEVGASFGSGASQTMFGSQGSTSFLVKVTGILAGLFFMTSLLLGYLAAHHTREIQADSLVSAHKMEQAPIPDNTVNAPLPAELTTPDQNTNNASSSLQQSTKSVKK